MPEKDRPQITEEGAPPPVDYAFWDVPGASFKVIYSLPLFHEIDFEVNEGYRKIPHGGIEVAGLLFGTIDEEAVRIEAFRPIECEHASGPSLNFSERDLAGLKEQITSSASDSQLKGYRPIGWFLAHTRGPLEMTEAEARQFDQFFPQTFNLTVLVKPERFQPTRFGFLVRKADGPMPLDATSMAVILPLPGRSHKAGQLIPSLTAPVSNKAKRSTPKEDPPPRPTVQADDFDDDLIEVEKPVPLPIPVAAPVPKVAAPPKKVDPATMSIWKIPPELDEGELAADERGAQELPETEVEFRTPAEKAARKQLSRDRARLIEQAFPPPPQAPFRPSALPSLPASAALPTGSPYSGRPAAPQSYAPEPGPAPESVINPRSVTALSLAALLGCLVGYVAYLQLPAPVIPIDVRASNQTVVVSWPPEETRNSIYAAIRLNDGPPVPLSADEKRSGQVSLTAAKDFKVEVLARNWIRDSRGIVRYLHSANGNGQVVPTPLP